MESFIIQTKQIYTMYFKNSLDNPGAIIIFIFGVIVCLFTLFFIATGMDEIWNGFNIWWYGVGIAGTLASIGIASILISLNKDNRAPRILFFSTLFFIFIGITGFIFS